MRANHPFLMVPPGGRDWNFCRAVALVLCPALLGWSIVDAEAGDGSFMGLDHLPGGQDISYVYGLAESGDLIVGESFSANARNHGEGVRWLRRPGGEWQTQGMGLPTADSLDSPALAVSGNGRQVVGRVSFDMTAIPTPLLDTEPYRWNAAGGFERLAVPAGLLGAQANGASHSGSVVAGFGFVSPGYSDLRALIWQETAAGWEVRFLEPAAHSVAMRSDSSGRYVIGWVRTPAAGLDGREAVLWSLQPDGTFLQTPLGALPGETFYSTPLVIRKKRNALLIGGSSGSPESPLPVTWTVPKRGPPQLTLLPLPEGYTSGWISAISADGERLAGVCRGEFDDTYHWSACVWEGGDVQTLEQRLGAAGAAALSGWTIWDVAGISADGSVISGSGNDPDYYDRGWVAELH